MPANASIRLKTMCGLKSRPSARMPREVVVDAEHAHLVSHLAQRLDDVVLHLPLGFEDVDAGRVLGRDEMVVDERQDRGRFSQEQPVPAAVQMVHRLDGEEHGELLARLVLRHGEPQLELAATWPIMSSMTWSIVYW